MEFNNGNEVVFMIRASRLSCSICMVCEAKALSISWLAYLSSLKLLLLKPPNTPFKSLPTTQNTSKKRTFIEIILLTFITFAHIVSNIVQFENGNTRQFYTTC